MIIIAQECEKCNSINIVKNGKNKSGSQSYHCKDCGKYGILTSVKKTSKLNKIELIKCFTERLSYNGVARIFDISASTVARFLKEFARGLPPLDTTILPLSDGGDTIEADEVWTFVKEKENIKRVWLAISRETKQILSLWIGDGSMEDCKRLWRKIPTEYQKQKSFSDFWASYNCIPKETHKKVGKETGETAHVERINNTIRQTFSRMVRKALSFSKKLAMLNLHFKLWAYQYNMKIKEKLSIS